MARPSDRDVELIRHLANGLTDQQIARRLRTDPQPDASSAHPQAVLTRILRLRRRVGAVNRPHLVAIAMREGWIE